ncbi:MAG TPA: chemotaxis protein CheW [Gemmatimonadaceae bacterium]|nr:chemotaxis protein CheW [Gemmatimonadaceae bacterium]
MTGPRARRSPRDLENVAWAELHARVEEVGRTLAGGSAADPAAVLAARARELARVPAAPDAEPALEVLGFTLGERTFGIESHHVHEVLRDVRLTPLPGAAAPVTAVVAWRGRILTVLDLRGALGAPPGPAPATRLLVLGDERPELGLLADDIGTLTPLAATALHPLPEGATAQREYVRAITDDATVLLDGAAILRLHADEG